MSAEIDTAGAFSRVSGMLRRVQGGALQTELVAMLHDQGTQVASDIKGAASTRIQRRAATTVDTVRRADGVEISGGTGGGLGVTLFPGGEFGGRNPRKRAVVQPVYGRAVGAYRKRTTMMFLPHLGSEGYFFWPTIRDWLPTVGDEAAKTVDSTLTGRSL